MITVKRIWRRVLLAAYVVVLLTLTHLPPQYLEHSPIDLWDKLEHVLGYSGLGFLAVWAGDFGGGRRGLRLVLITGAVLALVAAGDESTQPFFMRNCDLQDWYADLIGITVGSTLAAAFGELCRRMTRSHEDICHLSVENGSPPDSRG